jgi:hypothetical protein
MSLDLMPAEEGAAVLNADTFRESHPLYAQLTLEKPEQASFLVNPDAASWTRKLIEDCMLTPQKLYT